MREKYIKEEKELVELNGSQHMNAHLHIYWAGFGVMRETSVLAQEMELIWRINVVQGMPKPLSGLLV